MSAIIRGLSLGVRSRLARAVGAGDVARVRKICVEAGLSKEEREKAIREATEKAEISALRREVKRREKTRVASIPPPNPHITTGFVRSIVGLAVTFAVINALTRALRAGDERKVRKMTKDLPKAQRERLLREARRGRSNPNNEGNPNNDEKKLSNDPATLRGQIGGISISKKGEFAPDKFTVLGSPVLSTDDPKNRFSDSAEAQEVVDATRRVLSKRADRIVKERDEARFSNPGHEVTTVQLKTPGEKGIRQVTRVRLGARTVTFMEKLSRKEAIKQFEKGTVGRMKGADQEDKRGGSGHLSGPGGRKSFKVLGSGLTSKNPIRILR